MLIVLLLTLAAPYQPSDQCGFVRFASGGAPVILDARGCAAYDLAGSNGAKGPDGEIDDKDVTVMLSNTSPTCPPCPSCAACDSCCPKCPPAVVYQIPADTLAGAVAANSQTRQMVADLAQKVQALQGLIDRLSAAVAPWLKGVTIKPESRPS